jgi:hypothetical protein
MEHLIDDTPIKVEEVVGSSRVLVHPISSVIHLISVDQKYSLFLVYLLPHLGLILEHSEWLLHLITYFVCSPICAIIK